VRPTTQRATSPTLRRALCGLFAVTALGGTAAAVSVAPAAVAAPDPCAASSIARTVGSVGTNTGIYLDAHPDTNQALTSISQQQAGPQSLVALKSYFDANPQVGQDLQAIQQPLTGLSSKCKLPISLPQVLGLLQAAQQGGLPGGLPASLPGAATAAQAVAGTTGTGPVAQAPAAAVPVAAGPLPGPAATTTH
jgi:heme-binding protein